MWAFISLLKSNIIYLMAPLKCTKNSFFSSSLHFLSPFLHRIFQKISSSIITHNLKFKVGFLPFSSILVLTLLKRPIHNPGDEV